MYYQLIYFKLSNTLCKFGKLARFVNLATRSSFRFVHYLFIVLFRFVIQNGERALIKVSLILNIILVEILIPGCFLFTQDRFEH